MSIPEAIAINQVTKIFGTQSDAVVALDNINLKINENEFFTLLGPSGCGKTTLLRMIAGFEHPTSGNILLHGEEISHLPPFMRQVNTVFQNYALFPHMTVAENIGFGLSMLNKSKAEIKTTVDEMLSLVQMQSMSNRRTDQISGGQQQRVALARALAPHPRVLLLDEPLSALDYKLRKGMQIELKRLQHETGITFIFVTHDQEEALTMSDRIAVINKGELLQVGTPNDIYDRPAMRFVADFIGDTNFLNARLIETDKQHSVIELANGEKLETVLSQRLTAGEQVTIAIRPEQTEITRDLKNTALQGKLSNIVYSGTDTHFHVELDSKEMFICRAQNSGHGLEPWTIGESVGIKIQPGCIQILVD